MKTAKSAVLLENEGRTATPQDLLLNDKALGLPNSSHITSLHICINITAFVSGSVTVAIEALDPASLTWYPIIPDPAPLTAVGMNIFKMGRGIRFQDNSTLDFIPENVRIRTILAGGTNMTYSVGCNVEYDL